MADPIDNQEPVGSAGPLPPAPSPRVGEGGSDHGVYWVIPPALKRKMTEVARGFRKAPTHSEALLWQALRRKQLDGRRFRRQQPLGPFVVDFFCGAERLIVEVDGPIHAAQEEYDRRRQELLEHLGLKVLRLPADLVEQNLPEALALIRAAFGPNPPIGPLPQPLSHKGRGEPNTPPVAPPLPSWERGQGGEGQ